MGPLTKTSRTPRSRKPRDKKDKKLGGKYLAWESERQRLQNDESRVNARYIHVTSVMLIKEVIETVERKIEGKKEEKK